MIILRSGAFRALLTLDVAANVVADVSEDWTSLEKLGVLRKGTLHPRTERLAGETYFSFFFTLF